MNRCIITPHHTISHSDILKMNPDCHNIIDETVSNATTLVPHTRRYTRAKLKNMKQIEVVSKHETRNMHVVNKGTYELMLRHVRSESNPKKKALMSNDFFRYTYLDETTLEFVFASALIHRKDHNIVRSSVYITTNSKFDIVLYCYNLEDEVMKIYKPENVQRHSV